MVDKLMDVRLYGRKVEWMDGWTGAHLTPNHMLFLCPFPPSTSLRMETCNDKKSKKGIIFSFLFFIFFFFHQSLNWWKRTWQKRAENVQKESLIHHFGPLARIATIKHTHRQ